MVSGERLIVLFQARFLQAVGFTSVCSTWCRGRGQSGAVISWYAAVRNEARARRMMLRGDDFWQFELLPQVIVPLPGTPEQSCPALYTRYFKDTSGQHRR
jgi:hypothetical protein